MPITISPVAVYGVLLLAALWAVDRTPWYHPYEPKRRVISLRWRTAAIEGLMVLLVWTGVMWVANGQLLDSLLEGGVAGLVWSLVTFGLGAKLQLTPPD